MSTDPKAVVVGCGLIGARRARALRDAGVELSAVYDLDPSRATALGDALAVPVARSLDAALDGLPGLVVVATDHSGLASCGAEAIKRGSHVLLEKPGARNATELRAVKELARANDVSVRVGYNHRFHPSFLRIRELTETASYGPLLHVRARYGHGGRIGYEREWRADRARSGGGELVDQGVHLLDLTRFVTGDELELAYCELRTDFWAMDVEDNVYLALRPRRGGFAWLHASWTEWKNLFSFEIAWRHAKLEVSGLGGSYGTERLTRFEMRAEMGPPDTTIWEWPRADTSWEAETADVLAGLRGEPTIGATLDDALAVLTIVEQASA